MLCTVRLYYNTKFDRDNIPGTASLLNSASHNDFPGNYELQNSSINQTIIEATVNDVNNADYLRLGDDKYFFINGFTMLNENACLLHIEEDSLTTLGGACNLSYEGGILTRAHVSSANDGLFSNVTIENIGPLKPLKVVASDSADTEGTAGKITVIASTLNLDTGATVDSTTGQIIPPTGDNAPHAITFKDGTALNPDDLTITIPQSLPLSTESALFVQEGTAGTPIVSQTAGYGLYAYDNCKVDIQYLRSLNLDSALLYCYQLPLNLFTTNTASKHVGFRGVGFDMTPIHTPYERSDYTARNKKVYAMFSEYRLSADLSGEEVYLLPQDLYKAGETYPTFIGGADPQPNGKSWLRPSTFQGRTVNNWNFKAVHSLPWRNTPIAFNSPAGSMFIENDYKKNAHQIRTEYWEQYGSKGGVKSMLSGAAAGGASGGVFGMLGGAFINGMGHLGQAVEQGIERGADLENKLAENDYNYYQKQIVAPDLTCQPALGLQTFKSETYRVEYIGPDASDLARFDKYFDYYGYAMDGTPFDASYLTNRTNCNYIQAQDIHIISNSTTSGLATKQRAEAQLNRGVRIWHTTPFNMTSNP